MLSFLGFILALIIGTLYPYGSHLVDVGGFFRKAKNFRNQNCQLIQRKIRSRLALDLD
jgi:hypothetical protein